MYVNRESVVHLLAVRPYKKPELISRLTKGKWSPLITRDSIFAEVERNGKNEVTLNIRIHILTCPGMPAKQGSNSQIICSVSLCVLSVYYFLY